MEKDFETKQGFYRDIYFFHDVFLLTIYFTSLKKVGVRQEAKLLTI